ncbi:phospholipase D-like domain-containing protein [Chromobacterium haemolyticum]|nr:phospholipase D-like domain-containing protein [Chromobacterium haemolyticum]
MLESLGRADTIPGVARLEKADDVEARLGQAKQAEREAKVVSALNVMAPAKLKNKIKEAEADATAYRERMEKEYEAAQQPDAPISAVEQPGLKTHICSIVAPDSPGGAWAETYIHAKLMIINDAFLTLGSANINTRSMQVDSELNIALDRPEISKPLRQELWGRHTNSWSGANPDRMDREAPAKQAFKKWRDILNENKAAFSNSLPPVAPLREFLRTDPARSNSD